MSATRLVRSTAAVALAWLLAGAAALACPICYQGLEGSAADGVKTAVVVLVGVTTAILSGFAVFVVRFVHRQRHTVQQITDPTSSDSIANPTSPLADAGSLT